MDKKRLLFVISSLNTGGAQRALSNLVCALPESKWGIDILLNNAKNIVYPYRGNLIDLGIREPRNRSGILYQLKVLLIRYGKLRKLKKTRQYAACISFLESANFANIITGNKYCKTIASVRNNLSMNKSRVQRLIARMSKFFYCRADHIDIVALSKGVERDLVLNLGLPGYIVSTIYCGFDVEKIKSRAGSRAPAQCFTFITAGRCEYQKGQWHLIRAFAAFAKKHDNSRLVILGDGPYVDYYRELIDAYDISGSVMLKGFVDNPFSELVNADVFVFPSLFEGFGNALIEAMICGLPVICSDYRSGAREILAPDTDIDCEQMSEIELAEYGVVVPVCSGVKHSAETPLEPAELLLLEAMEMLYADEGLRNRCSQASEKRALDFSIEKIAEHWSKLF